jgi:hypothetical protein
MRGAVVVTVGCLLLLGGTPVFAQGAPNPLLDAPAQPTPPPPAPPAPTAKGARSWSDMGVDDALPQKDGPHKPAATPADHTVPWGTAFQVGLAATGAIWGWTLISIPLGMIPVVGVLAQLIGLGLPFLASGTGWWFGQKYRDVRAPLKAVLLAGLIQLGVDVCCMLPFVCTPLAPIFCPIRCAVDSVVNGLATTFMVRRYGRMKVPGEPELSWDLSETPPPGPTDVLGDPNYVAPNRGGADNSGTSFMAPSRPANPPPRGAPPAAPNPADEEGTSVK